MADKRELQLVLALKDNASKSLSKIGKTWQKNANQMKIAGLAIVGVLGFVGKKSLELASDAFEVQNKFEAVFGSLTEDATAFVDTLSDAVGRNKTELKDGLASFQGFSIGMGLVRQEAFDMATQLQALSIDFASFNNMSDGEAQQRFISAMSGSAEVLDRFGINLRVAALDQELLSMGLGKTALEATEAEKATARFNIIMKTMGEQGAVGDAIKTADSYANRLKRLQGNVKTLQENIGLALMPTMSDLAGSMIGLTEDAKDNQTSLDTLSKGIFRFTNFIIAMGKGVNAIIVSLVNFSAVMMDAGAVVRGFLADIGENFIKLFKNVGAGVRGILKVFKGDFEGAAAEFGNVLSASFNRSSSAMDDLKFNAGISAGLVKDAWSGVGESLDKAINLKGFVPVSLAAKKFHDALADDAAVDEIEKNSKKSKEELAELADGLETLNDEYLDLSQDSSDALFDLEKNHHKALSSIQEDILRTKKAIGDLKNSFNEERKADIGGLASDIIKSEDRIAEIQEELAGQVSHNRKAVLEKELSEEQKLFEDNADLFKSMEGEIAEARRVAGLSDLGRALDEFHKKRAIAQQEFNEKIGRLQSEMKALKKKEQQEITLFQNKKSIIETLRLELAQSHQQIVKQEFDITKDAIVKEIKLYEELAKAISRVRGGDAADLSRITSAAVGTNLINTTIVVKDNNINAEDPDEAGQRIGEALMDQIRLNERLTI